MQIIVSEQYIRSQTVRPSTEGWYHLVMDYMRSKGQATLTRDGPMWERRLYERAIKWPFND